MNPAKLRRYRVASGELDKIIEAETPQEAVVIAAQQEHDSDSPAELSTIMEVIEIADGPFVFDTETVCRSAGVWKFHLPAT
jgi:hypothetical protein